MALLKQAEFADKCLVNTAAISVNKKRGNVVVRADGLIDDQDLVNQKFYTKAVKNAEKRATKTVIAENVEGGEEQITPDSLGKASKMEEFPGKTPDKKVKKPPTAEQTALGNQLNEKFNVETELKRKQGAKADAEARMLAMKEQRLRGELLPTNLIKPLFQTHFQSLTMEFQNSLNALITDISVRLKINRNMQAEIRKKAVNEMNQSIDRAIFRTDKEIERMISQNT